jgi:hypothetical protein
MAAFLFRSRAFGDEESGLDIVGSDDDEVRALDAGIDESAFLLGIIHDDGLTGANQIVDGGRILVDQNINAWKDSA